MRYWSSIAVYRHRTIQNLSTVKPKLSDGVFVAESASVSGNVEIGPNSSVWFGTVLRGTVLQAAYITQYLLARPMVSKN
jgi:carbonic anhydrase/acetyltransferase-like protein (isoleucine patch superfamily)